jgi:hypothetical protein
VKPSSGTTLLTLKALPLIFWQSVQWQSACVGVLVSPRGRREEDELTGYL